MKIQCFHVNDLKTIDHDLKITILGWKRTKDERARDEKEKKKLEEEAKQEAKAKEVDENANHVQVIMKTHGYES